jgi:hypothetical protein
MRLAHHIDAADIDKRGHSDVALKLVARTECQYDGHGDTKRAQTIFRKNHTN